MPDRSEAVASTVAVPPCPGVRFDEGILSRVGRLVLRIRAARTRREGAGAGRLAGVGEEFVGHRPYRPGEDLRRLDWNLYARLDQLHVRLTRREASESWLILLDTSASMGVGPPGKLQRGAEVALALSSIGQRGGARVRVLATGLGGPGPLVSSGVDVAGLLSWLEGLRASGADGIGQALAPRSAVGGGEGRLFLVGDFLDLKPADLAAVAGARRGRECFALQLLAPVEFEPDGDGAGATVVEWRDPETGETLRRAMDQVPAYEVRLERNLELYREACAAHGVRHVCRSTRVPFEDLVRELLGG